MKQGKAFHLYLTVEEAEALSRVCQCVGGSPRTSRRRFIDNIRRKLRARGFDDWRTDTDGRSVYFTEVN